MAWFLLRGLWPAVPTEQRPHDLLLETDSGVKRIQVKTTTFKETSSSWSVCIGRHAGGGSRHDRRVPYGSDEVDLLVIIDGDLVIYLIPLSAVSGRLGICLRLYHEFIVGNAVSILHAPHRHRQRQMDSPCRPHLTIGGTTAGATLPGASGAEEPGRKLREPDELRLDAPDVRTDKSARPATPGATRWAEADLRIAVECATSWADLLRAFGYKPSSTKPREELRRHVQRYRISTAHFAGKRTWSDQQLIAAAPEVRTWAELYAALGLTAGSHSYDSVLAAASRLGVGLHHLRLGPKCGPESVDIDLPHRAALANLRRAAQSISTAWFLLCGCAVSAPCEPARYDLVVDLPYGLRRVQVKSTTARGTRGSWLVRIGHRPDGASHTARLVPYDGGALDYFFIVDGDMMLYLIPAAAVAGKASLILRGYRRFIVGDASSLLEPGPVAPGAR